MIESPCGRSFLVGVASLSLASRVAAEPALPVTVEPAPARPTSLPQLEVAVGAHSGNLLASNSATTPAPFERLASAAAAPEGALRVSWARQGAAPAPNVVLNAALRLELRLTAANQGMPLAWRDLSSAFGATFRAGADTRLSFAVFPFDTNYTRLGHLHALDWGGTDAAQRDSVFVSNPAGAPGAALALDAGPSRLRLATKTALTTDPWLGQHRLWGIFGAASFALSPAWVADAALGYFQRPAWGPNAPPSFLEGANARLMWHTTAPEPELATEPLRVPELAAEPFGLTRATGPDGAAIALEGSLLVSRPAAPALPPAERLRAAPAAAVYGSFRASGTALHAVLAYRSLAFAAKGDSRIGAELLENQLEELAELSGWVGGSVQTLSGHVTPSCELGLQLPAGLRGPSVWPTIPQTFVLGMGGLTPLPMGADRLPSFAARLGLRVDPAPWFRFGVAVTYQRDPNRSMLADSPRGVTWSFGAPDALGVLVGATAAL